jgi:hypothetical protein
LIAAVEAAISFSSQKIHWQRWRRMVTAAAAIFVAALAVSFLDWQAYRKEFLADDLRVNFQISHPNRTGTSDLALTFLVATKAQVSVLLQETIAVESSFNRLQQQSGEKQRAFLSFSHHT